MEEKAPINIFEQAPRDCIRFNQKISKDA